MKQHSPGFLKLVEETRPRVREMTVAEVRAWLAERRPFRFVDVREDREWSQGHALGAEHLSRGILERDVERAIPDWDTPVVLYCGGGFRSVLAADNLQKMGYRRVWSMAGGWTAWLENQGPVEPSR